MKNHNRTIVGACKSSHCVFTLIELLIVFAIIAILAAILFPVFGRGTENTRRSFYQSNLKQIGLGVMRYTQDYNEMLPHMKYAGDDTPTEAFAWSVDSIRQNRVIRHLGGGSICYTAGHMKSLLHGRYYLRRLPSLAQPVARF